MLLGMNIITGEKQMEKGPLIILWIKTTLVIYVFHTMFVCVLYSALLKTLSSIENRIKCHTKIHTETVLLFSLLLKTFTTIIFI